MNNEQYEINSLRLKLHETVLDHWLHHALFSFGWWLILICTLVSWYCLFRYINRKNIIEILLYGAFVTLAALVLDIIGVNMVLWDYPLKFDPLSPPLLPIDLVLIPIPYIFIYQKAATWKIFFIAHLTLSAVFAFVIEPLLVRIRIYELYRWHHAYSFIIYLGMAITLRWIVKRLTKIQNCHTNTIRESN